MNYDAVNHAMSVNVELDSVPNGQMFGDYVYKSAYGVFADEKAMMRHILDRPEWLGNDVQIIRFNKITRPLKFNNQGPWTIEVVYVEKSCISDEACDHTIWRIDRERETQGLPPLTAEEWDTLEPNLEDCEQTENLEVEQIEVITF
jgi:hypothetical protein